MTIVRPNGEERILAALEGIKTRLDDMEKHLNDRVTSVEAHFNDRFNGIENQLIEIRGDLRQFWHELGRHDARLDNLEGRQ